MNFSKYTSIENIYRKEFVDLIKRDIPKNTLFCVQEKIHGGNLSMHYGKNTDYKVMVAGKNGFLEDNGLEYHFHKRVFNKYSKYVIKLFNAIKDSGKAIESLVVYGEIFGGYYPHPDVKKVKGIGKINSAIFYTPDIEFLVFDVNIDGEYLNLLEAEILCNKNMLPFDPILFTGTFEECINYGNLFESKIATEILGLPKIENNICEGIVIKSIKPMYLRKGNRAIIKNKNSKWKEKVKKRKINVEIEITKEGQNMLDELCRYITESRIDNVFSKIGTIKSKDFGKVVGLYSKDVMEEFGKDFSLDDLDDKVEKKKIKKIFQGKVSKIIRERFKKEIDLEK